MSFMSTLETIEGSAFANLTALLHFNCSHNPHLNYIHEHAFARPNSEDPHRLDYPPLVLVNMKKYQLINMKLMNHFHASLYITLFFS